MTARVQLQRKNPGSDSQRDWHQDELIGGKPPVVKWLWLCEEQRVRQKPMWRRVRIPPLWVVEGDEKGIQCLGHNWATLILGVINKRTWPSRLWESLIWDSKIWSWARGTQIREWLCLREPAAIVNDRLVLTSERVPHINKPATVWQ
jgi:hypothetical protein